MDNSTTNNVGQPKPNLVDRAADKVQSGVNEAKDMVEQAGDKLSRNVETLRSNAGPALDKLTGQAKAVAQQGVDAVNTVARQASDVSDSILSYTKENPMKALLLAVASGALLLSVVRALTPSRE
jgi:ElaB/YqjD/DUF883 family membrane-anchored ribosome-binding protein